MSTNRIDAVMANLAARGLSQILECDPRSIQYLVRAYVEPGERFLGLRLRADHARPTLFLNKLFTAPEGIEADVVAFNDTDDPIALLAEHCDTAAALGCDKNLPARFLIPMVERNVAAGFVLASDAVDDARA